jgi:hypothetical protein
MGKYKKKPVEIDAEKISDILKNATSDWMELPEWVRTAYENGDLVFANTHLIVNTLEGSMVGGYEDILIRGIQGEIYPCKPDIFASTYDEVKGG